MVDVNLQPEFGVLRLSGMFLSAIVGFALPIPAAAAAPLHTADSPRYLEDTLISETDKMRAVALLDQAEVLQRRGQLDEAARLLSQAAVLYPTARTFGELGMAE